MHDLSKLEKHEYGERHNTFSGIGILVKLPMIFDMSKARKEMNVLNASNVQDMVHHLHGDSFSRPRHYWVVSSNKYKNFQKPSTSGTGLDSMEQYVLEISIERAVNNRNDDGDDDQDNERSVCEHILQSGGRKGEKCGRINCSS